MFSFLSVSISWHYHSIDHPEDMSGGGSIDLPTTFSLQWNNVNSSPANNKMSIRCSVYQHLVLLLQTVFSHEQAARSHHWRSPGGGNDPEWLHPVIICINSVWAVTRENICSKWFIDFISPPVKLMLRLNNKAIWLVAYMCCRPEEKDLSRSVKPFNHSQSPNAPRKSNFSWP